MYSGVSIKKLVDEGRMVITPFDPNQVNPNSYNLRLGDTLKVYKDVLPAGIRPWIPVKKNGKYSITDWYETKWDCLKDIVRPSHYFPNPKLALDPDKNHKFIETQIPKNGLMLRPNTLYIAHTLEYTGNKDSVPMLDGRSSIGRLGIYIHVTAGFGDVGFGWDYEKNTGMNDGKGNRWTLEIQVVHPIIVYSGMEICQMRVEEVSPDFTPYNGRYAKQTGAETSRFFMNGGKKITEKQR
jgi:dCTP deaminase